RPDGAARTRFLTIPALALVLGAMGCGRGCTCLSGEKTYEHLDGPVKVELVRKTHWTSSRFPGPISKFVIRVHTVPPFDEPTACEKVDLAEDDAAKNVAFRCDKTGEWTVLRLRGKDRHIRECKPPVGTGSKPSFGALATVVDAAAQLLDCAESPDVGERGERSAEIVRSVREEGGSAAATALVVSASARSGAFAPDRRGDSWESMLEALTPPERATALARLCEGLVRAETAPAAYLHAIRWCALDDVQGTGDAALARLRAMLRGGAELGNLELRWIAALASRARPIEAGDLACTSGRDLRAPGAEVLIALIARARTRCPAVTAALTPPPCSERIDCDGGLCTAIELNPQIDAWVRSSVTGDRDDAGARDLQLYPLERDRALLAAAYAQGPLPRALALPNARRRYALAQDAGPSCGEAELAEGAPCTCEQVTDWARCGAAVDEKRFTAGSCDVQIDDAKRRLDARHVCAHDQAPCGSSQPCCPGLACARHDGSALKCEPARDGGDGG
ncbi:MAG TPA: hypothetical protein VLT33_06950, partial [Labilithrix sp.]|nr:hypothetical protein [Labilithrix sp.]